MTEDPIGPGNGVWDRAGPCWPVLACAGGMAHGPEDRVSIIVAGQETATPDFGRPHDAGQGK